MVGSEGDSEIWRCSANGGVNVLYCYLRINKIYCEYASLAIETKSDTQKQEYCTVFDLTHAAGKYGVGLAAVHLTIKDLSEYGCPIIVYLDGESLGTGFFLLILKIEDENVYYLNGPSATIAVMTQDDFRRVWGGVALVPKLDVRRKANSYLVGAGSGMAIWLLGKLVAGLRKT